MTFTEILAKAASDGLIDIANAPEDRRAKWAVFSKATTDPVSDWLNQHPPFQAVSGQILHRGGGSELVQSSSTARYLTERAIKFGPEAVSASFDNVMMGAPFTCAKVVVVNGISTSCPVEIFPGITLEPIKGLLDVSTKAHALNRVFQMGIREEPTAIVSRVETAPIYSPSVIASEPYPAPVFMPYPSIGLTLDAISLVAGVSVTTGFSYEFVEEIGWPTMLVGGQGEFFPSRKTIEIDSSLVPALQETVELLEAHPRGDSLTRAIQKLKDAQRRLNPAERALDMGACLEILLMHGEKTGNTEIGYKLRMRAAWLLGGDAVDRQRVHDVVKFAYNARSKVAHEGVLPALKSIEELRNLKENLDQVERLCQNLITHILKNDWPNWKNILLQC